MTRFRNYDPLWFRWEDQKWGRIYNPEAGKFVVMHGDTSPSGKNVLIYKRFVGGRDKQLANALEYLDRRGFMPRPFPENYRIVRHGKR